MQTILSAEFSDQSFQALPLPARAGVGLKPEHVSDILNSDADMGFFEIHAENYMGAGGMPHAQLAAIREKYPLSVHGVGMSIGGDAPLSIDHLTRFKAIVERYQPGLVSEHLAWSTHDDVFYNDLLPAPYTNETLHRVADHIDQMQNFLGRQVLIENPSTYVIFAQSTWSEVDFMAEFAARTGCGLLLDVNNVFVSATNHGYLSSDYIKAFPLHLVQEIHLAGHAPDVDDCDRPLLIDAHDREVCEEVWELYKLTLSITGPLPSLIEWDADIPDWPVLAAEAVRANEILGRNIKTVPTPAESYSNMRAGKNAHQIHGE
ncbi:MAG: DUF692 domain-containing protein [Hyphomicrobiales bacterium]|nr:DUF692 domain-containing protein [Hyphomicrobiales bacterium]